MKSFFAFTTLAVLLSSASAATVTLEETPCLQETELETFTIEADKLVAKELSSVCGLKIVSVSGAETSQVTCQAFKDAAGAIAGSAKFTYTTPALISTNPVQEAAIKCDLSNPSATVSMTVTATADTTVVDTVSMTATVSPDTTVIGTGSPTGGPTGGSGNGTAPTGPSQPSQTTEPWEGKAGVMQVGVGAMVAGFAALLL